MRTRVARVKGEGVAAGWFYLAKDESFVLGQKPNKVETMVDDFQPVKEARFIVKGKTLTENTFNSIVLDYTSPIPEKANPKWAKITAMEETIGFCMSTNNPKHDVIKPMRITLKPGEKTELEVAGFLCVARDAARINGEEISGREIIRLSGKKIEIVAGPAGADIGVLHVEFVD